MSGPASTRWRLVDPAGIRIRRFEDEALVFNPRSWETHLLNVVATRVVDALALGPRTEVELVETLRSPGIDHDGAEVEEAEIDHFLRDLESLGLIEAADA